MMAQAQITERKVVMKKLIVLLVMSGALTAHANTFYLVDGKLVATAGEATKAGHDGKEVIKIQVSKSKFNPTTYRLKKSDDLTFDELKTVINKN